MVTRMESANSLLRRVSGDQSLTCIPANEVAVGFRCTRRTSLLELMTTRLAEDLRADISLPLEVLVIMVRDNETERNKGLVMRNLRVIDHVSTNPHGPVTWNNVTRIRLHYTTPGGTSNYRTMTHNVQ